MNLDNLWVGDKILVKSAAEVGTFEKKINDTTAIIKFKIGTSEIPIDDMELANDKPIGPLITKKEKPVEKIIADDEPVNGGFSILSKAEFKNEIDLHFEKLSSTKKESDYANVMDFQLRMCRAYLEQAIEFKLPEVKIIHGKGNGVLRAAVIDLLKEYKENIYWNFEGENKGGAVIIMLKY